jgi:hypothetical protein
MIDVANDAEGVRMALEEMFEEDFVHSRIERDSKGASEETRERLAAQLPARTLSPGYYQFGSHLFWLDSLRKAGIEFGPDDLLAYEARGLVALTRARGNFEYKHPDCGSCHARQQTRFGAKCDACGVEFRRKR